MYFYAMCGMIAIALIVILGYMAIERAITWKRIKAHQKEWDEIKRRTPKHLRFDAYNDYIRQLWKCRDSFGACFPRY